MKVIKIGGGCLKDGPTAKIILDLAAARGKGNIFVVSAFYGITNALISGIDAALASEDTIEGVIQDLKTRHQIIVDCLVKTPEEKKRTLRKLDELLGKLERYYFGISFTREATPRMRDMIAVSGERMSAMILAAAMAARNIESGVVLPEEAGIITDGKFMDATALMAPTRENLSLRLGRQVTENKILFVPGFYGISETGEITTFGRGGSDYSAAVVTAGVSADLLEIWKDTPGFMTADPDNIPECRLIPELTYEEAAELAYTGAGILHPRTVEPVRQAGIDIAVKNTYDPDARGSRITRQAREADTVIKSVSYTRDVAILKIHASGVGARQGILSLITQAVSGGGINIKSVVTSQTCISLLVSKKGRPKRPCLYPENLSPAFQGIRLQNPGGPGQHRGGRPSPEPGHCGPMFYSGFKRRCQHRDDLFRGFGCGHVFSGGRRQPGYHHSGAARHLFQFIPATALRRVSI